MPANNDDSISSAAVLPSPTVRLRASGKLTAAIVASIGIFAAACAWLYHYDLRRQPRVFWGFVANRLFQDAANVTAYLIEPERNVGGEKPPYHESLFMVGAERYVVRRIAQVSQAADEASREQKHDFQAIRTALCNHAGYEFDRKVWNDPVWRYALKFEDRHPQRPMLTTMVVIDSEGRVGRPQTVDKTVSTAPMSETLQRFFTAVFPEAKSLPERRPRDLNSLHNAGLPTID